MTKQFTLGKEERLKSRKTIELLFSKGKRFTLPPWKVYYLFDDLSTVPLKFGVGVSSRNFKKAVDRNRVKRLARETWRLQKPGFASLLKEQKTKLHVFIVYTGRDLPEYSVAYESMGKVMDKLARLVNTKK